MPVLGDIFVFMGQTEDTSDLVFADIGIQFHHAILRGRSAPKRVVGWTRPERRMRIKHMEEDEKRLILVLFQPGDETVHVMAGGLAIVFLIRERALLVQFVVALVH